MRRLIDRHLRFDGRSLLDYMPTTSKHYDNKEDDMTDELNFERYHDLIEAERLNGNPLDHLKVARLTS